MKNYKTASELYSDLLNQNSVNSFFNWCCSCIDFYADKLGCTYEELNIYLFVILEPVIILLLLGLLIYKSKQYSRLKKALELKATIDTNDKAIDAMVYELYGLTAEEIEIVEKS